MSVVITKEDLMAYSEVDYIIKHMNEKYIHKLPKKLLDFFETMKIKDYSVDINPYKPLEEQGLQEYTLEIIAVLHIKYWCENEARKQELIEKMNENQKKFEEQLQAKLGTDVFQKQENQHRSSHETLMTAYSKFLNANPDIQDYTDVIEETKETEIIEKIEEKQTLWNKIVSYFKKRFGKK